MRDIYYSRKIQGRLKDKNVMKEEEIRRAFHPSRAIHYMYGIFFDLLLLFISDRYRRASEPTGFEIPEVTHSPDFLCSPVHPVLSALWSSSFLFLRIYFWAKQSIDKWKVSQASLLRRQSVSLFIPSFSFLFLVSSSSFTLDRAALSKTEKGSRTNGRCCRCRSVLVLWREFERVEEDENDVV